MMTSSHASQSHWAAGAGTGTGPGTNIIEHGTKVSFSSMHSTRKETSNPRLGPVGAHRARRPEAGATGELRRLDVLTPGPLDRSHEALGRNHGYYPWSRSRT